MKTYKVITAATTLPVSVDEVKAHMGIYHNEKDANILVLLRAAIAKAESFTGRTFRPGGEIVEMLMDAFWSPVEIERAPVTGITSVKYFDGANQEQTLATGNYDADISSAPAVITFMNAPAVYGIYRHDAVKVRFVAGYANAAAVPDDVKAAILLATQFLYDNPGDAVHQLPTTSEYLLRDYRLH